MPASESLRASNDASGFVVRDVTATDRLTQWFAFGHDVVGTKSEALDKINRIDELLPWRYAQTR